MKQYSDSLAHSYLLLKALILGIYEIMKPCRMVMICICSIIFNFLSVQSFAVHTTIINDPDFGIKRANQSIMSTDEWLKRVLQNYSITNFADSDLVNIASLVKSRVGDEKFQKDYVSNLKFNEPRNKNQTESEIFSSVYLSMLQLFFTAGESPDTLNSVKKTSLPSMENSSTPWFGDANVEVNGDMAWLRPNYLEHLPSLLKIAESLVFAFRLKPDSELLRKVNDSEFIQVFKYRRFLTELAIERAFAEILQNDKVYNQLVNELDQLKITWPKAQVSDIERLREKIEQAHNLNPIDSINSFVNSDEGYLISIRNTNTKILVQTWFDKITRPETGIFTNFRRVLDAAKLRFYRSTFNDATETINPFDLRRERIAKFKEGRLLEAYWLLQPPNDFKGILKCESIF